MGQYIIKKQSIFDMVLWLYSLLIWFIVFLSLPESFDWKKQSPVFSIVGLQAPLEASQGRIQKAFLSRLNCFC